MPITPIDYSKNIIYKIQHREIDDLLYVGSTTDFTRRKAQHKYNCIHTNDLHYKFKLYSSIRANGGWDAFNMVIIKEFPCKNKREAEAEEDIVIRELKSDLNTNRAYLSPEDRKESKMRYYYDNHEQVLKYAKIYRKNYRETHKETISEKNKQKFSCLCGSKYTLCHKSRHFKTKKHQEFIKANIDP